MAIVLMIIAAEWLSYGGWLLEPDVCRNGDSALIRQPDRSSNKHSAPSGAILLVGVASSATFPTACTDIQMVDFANMQIPIPDCELVQFKNGRGSSSEGEGFKTKDWELTIKEDVPFTPQLGSQLRLLRISCSHLTGSGAWDYVVMFECKEGIIRSIFQSRFLYGVKLDKHSDIKFTLTYGVWLKGDEHCCPSKEEKDTYKWDGASDNYKCIAKRVYPLPNDALP